MQIYFSLLVKLGVVASIASTLARSNHFKSMLMRENRTLNQRLALALVLSRGFRRLASLRAWAGPQLLCGRQTWAWKAACWPECWADMCPDWWGHSDFFAGDVSCGEHLSMPLLAAVGVVGGLLRDLAADPEDIWRFSPFLDLNILRFFKESRNHRRTKDGVSPAFGAGISALGEFLRYQLRGFSHGHKEIFFLADYWGSDATPLAMTALFATTLFAVTIPLKIWNNTRNEKKLEEQSRLLVEARLAALASQINPHFLFNTLNSVSSLIRTDPNQARAMVVKLSKVLRRLLRKHENFSALRDELSFIEDYLSIEVIRFGDKLRFEKDVADDTLDMLVPSMLLQPLVENSIKHGLSSKVEGGTIRIHGRRSESRLHLLVEDDGVGIPEAKLATLLDRGIGVSNVNERLKVLFGGDYRMWIDSQPGKGTRIQIEVPELQSTLAAVS